MLRGTPRLAITLRCGFRFGRTLTDGAGGFLPGVPLGCLGMGSQRSQRRRVPGPNDVLIEPACRGRDGRVLQGRHAH